jgi:hypothetical protein
MSCREQALSTRARGGAAMHAVAAEPCVGPATGALEPGADPGELAEAQAILREERGGRRPSPQYPASALMTGSAMDKVLAGTGADQIEYNPG